MRSTCVWSARYTQIGRRWQLLESDDDNERSAWESDMSVFHSSVYNKCLLPMSLSFLPSNSQVSKHQSLISPRSSHSKLHLHPRGIHQAFIMKAFTMTAALVALAGLSHAAPAPTTTPVACPECIMLNLNATFFGAGPDPPSYTETVSTNSGVFVICTSISPVILTLRNFPIRMNFPSSYTNLP